MAKSAFETAVDSVFEEEQDPIKAIIDDDPNGKDGEGEELDPPGVKKEGGDSGDDKNGARYKALQELYGKQSNELGELRKQVKEMADELKKGRETKPATEKPVDEGPKLPPAPLRDKFKTEDEYQAAMSKWFSDCRKVEKDHDSAAVARRAQQDADKAANELWASSKLSDEDKNATMAFWSDPETGTPENLNLARVLLTDPDKRVREVMKELQKIVSRRPAPTSSGIGSGETGDEDGMSAEEVASFHKAMNAESVPEQNRLIRIHEKRFGRFEEPKKA